MKDNVMDTNAIPSLLFRLFSTERVSVTETDGMVQLVPIKDESDCTVGLRGILAGYDDMSVDKFMERKRADKDLDL